VLAAATATASAAEPQAPLVVRLGVELVQVDAVVTDKKGRAVTDLRPADFEIRQDGRPQVVTQAVYVGGRRSTGPAAPADEDAEVEGAVAPEEGGGEALVFVVDELMLSLDGVNATRRALLSFADAMEDDAQVFLLRTGKSWAEMRPVTGPGELRALARGLSPRLRAGPGGFADLSGLDRTPLDVQALATTRYLTWVAARQSLLSLQDITDALRSWRGRKTLVLFSEGFPVSDPTRREPYGILDAVYGRGEDVPDELDRLTDLANRASVVIHTVDPGGLRTVGITAADGAMMSHATILNTLSRRRGSLHATQGSLERLAEHTGGLSVLNSNDVGSGVARILESSRSYYLVGYEPPPETFARREPRFHKLEVRVKRPGLKVRSRRGFFGLSDAQVTALAPPQTF
jgi:VWFA-related protein